MERGRMKGIVRWWGEVVLQMFHWHLWRSIFQVKTYAILYHIFTKISTM